MSTYEDDINVEFAEKCKGCSVKEVKTESVKLYAGGEVFMTSISINCEHRRVCDRIEKMLREGRL